MSVTRAGRIRYSTRAEAPRAVGGSNVDFASCADREPTGCSVVDGTSRGGEPEARQPRPGRVDRCCIRSADVYDTASLRRQPARRPIDQFRPASSVRHAPPLASRRRPGRDPRRGRDARWARRRTVSRLGQGRVSSDRASLRDRRTIDIRRRMHEAHQGRGARRGCGVRLRRLLNGTGAAPRRERQRRGGPAGRLQGQEGHEHERDPRLLVAAAPGLEHRADRHARRADQGRPSTARRSATSRSSTPTSTTRRPPTTATGTARSPRRTRPRPPTIRTRWSSSATSTRARRS